MAAGEIYFGSSNRLYYRDAFDNLRRIDPTFQGNYGGILNELWVSGSHLYGRQNTSQSARYTGTDTGASGTAGELYVSSSYLYYVDSSGNVRRLQGSIV